MPLRLERIGSDATPVSGESLRPDVLAALSADDASRLVIAVGNASAELGELFAISGSAGDGHLVLDGDLTHVRDIGRGMESGTITIRGDAGPGLGRGMAGGSIDLRGDAGDSCGAGMIGGMIRIKGSAGDNLGGSEPGARSGMRDGVILVEGSAGHDAGIAMRRGLIAVIGSCGDGLGRGMIAGSVFAFGSVGIHPGLGMKRGTVALFGGDPPRLVPTFAFSGRERPPFLAIYLKTLREWGFPVPESAFAETVARYNGDRAEGGQGEILVASSEAGARP
jgi:formylmethanofuran dehydrogenase subunit C